jgi:hypothetical protein
MDRTENVISWQAERPVDSLIGSCPIESVRRKETERKYLDIKRRKILADVSCSLSPSTSWQDHLTLVSCWVDRQTSFPLTVCGWQCFVPTNKSLNAYSALTQLTCWTNTPFRAGLSYFKLRRQLYVSPTLTLRILCIFPTECTYMVRVILRRDSGYSCFDFFNAGSENYIVVVTQYMGGYWLFGETYCFHIRDRL